MFIQKAGVEMTPDLLKTLIDQHKVERSRLDELRRMYESDHDILHQDDKAEYKPDNRLVVNFAKYIVDTFNGFFIGNPIKITHPDSSVNDYLEYLDKYNDQDDNNAELSKLCSIYGHGYEMLFTDESGGIGITYVEPQECFVVYDDSILRRPMFGIRYYVDTDKIEQGSFSTGTDIQYFHNDGGYIFDDLVPHHFGDVPIIEYLENEERQGIFEPVVTLINAFNKAISEKANDVDYYADAYLKVLGAKLSDESLRSLRDNRIINLHGMDAEKIIVDFLQKPDADGTQENLIDRLERLIFHISMVANINDENFGTSTGIALKYKLQSMTNLAKTKERKFTSGMNRRYKMIAQSPASKIKEGDWVGIDYQFTQNIPANLLEEADIAGKLSGVTSGETQLKVLSIVENVKEEIKKKQEEKSTQGYDTDYPTNRIQKDSQETTSLNEVIE